MDFITIPCTKRGKTKGAWEHRFFIPGFGWKVRGLVEPMFPDRRRSADKI